MTAASGTEGAEVARQRRIVRVAVIDSGVHETHPHVGGVAGGIGIDDSGASHEDYIDRLGHGTAVTAAIREKAPDAAIFAIKVFDRELTATGRALVAACEHALSINAHIVNLSLGTQNIDHEAALAEVVGRLHQGGAVVIAAGEQGGVRWLPGSLPGVWSVSLDWTVPRDTFRINRVNRQGASFRATGVPRPIPGVPPERNLRGLSFAVANVTGILARLLADDDTGDAVAVVSRAFERGDFS
jgi:subtilisin family serine protease